MEDEELDQEFIDRLKDAIRKSMLQYAREQAYIKKLHQLAQEQNIEVMEPMIMYRGKIIGNYLIWEN